jgi:hypothetical protein
MKTVNGIEIMEVLDARSGQWIEVFCHAAGPPHNKYQVTTHQPMLDGTHDRAGWRKIRAISGTGTVYLHPLNECKLVEVEKKS